MRRAVDWREVERELENLPEEFKDQGRFDSLPHVIEILRTLDPSQFFLNRAVCEDKMLKCVETFQFSEVAEKSVNYLID